MTKYGWCFLYPLFVEWMLFWKMVFGTGVEYLKLKFNSLRSLIEFTSNRFGKKLEALEILCFEQHDMSDEDKIKYEKELSVVFAKKIHNPQILNLYSTWLLYKRPSITIKSALDALFLLIFYFPVHWNKKPINCFQSVYEWNDVSFIHIHTTIHNIINNTSINYISMQ